MKKGDVVAVVSIAGEYVGKYETSGDGTIS
jgi:hypothetical protein